MVQKLRSNFNWFIIAKFDMKRRWNSKSAWHHVIEVLSNPKSPEKCQNWHILWQSRRRCFRFEEIRRKCSCRHLRRVRWHQVGSGWTFWGWQNRLYRRPENGFAKEEPGGEDPAARRRKVWDFGMTLSIKKLY